MAGRAQGVAGRAQRVLTDLVAMLREEAARGSSR
jgi:hypothetical protein